MGILIMFIAVIFYAFYVFKSYHRVLNYTEHLFGSNSWVFIIILGFSIALFANIFWDAVMVISIATALYFFIFDQKNFKEFFKDLF